MSLEGCGVYEAIALSCPRCGNSGELPRDYVGTRPTRYVPCPDCLCDCTNGRVREHYIGGGKWSWKPCPTCCPDPGPEYVKPLER